MRSRVLLLPLFVLVPGGCTVADVAKTAVDVVTLPVKAVSKGVDFATTSQSEADEKRGRQLRKADEQRALEERQMTERCRKNRKLPGDVCAPRSGSGSLMRYFLDTEYNGFGGQLLSLALVAEHGDEELYFTLPAPAAIHPWVERNVMPYMNHVPSMHQAQPLDRGTAAHALATFLANDRDIEIIADWPEDIAQICMLLLTGPGEIVRTPPLRFRFYALPGFSTAGASAVPHNALHDARSLRDHVLGLEDN